MRGKKFLGKFGILIFLLAICTFFSFVSDAFLTKNNLINILRQISVLGIASIGMTFIMVTGGVDLTVGSMGALAGVVCAKLMVEAGMHPIIAILLTLLITTLIGLLDGFIVVKFDVPPLITTLGMFTVLRGVCYLLTGGIPVFGFEQWVNGLGGGYIWEIPIPVIIFAVFFAVAYIFLHKSFFGRHVFAVGGNEEAARLSGINVKKVKLVVFSLGGLLAGFAGIVMMSRISSGQPSAMVGFEMEVVTAVVLGGISFTGGEGNLFGMLFGALILGVLANGLILLNVDSYWQQVLNGSVLIVAVALDKMSKKAAKEKVVVDKIEKA